MKKILVLTLLLIASSLLIEATEKNQSSNLSVLESWKNFRNTDIKKPSNGLSSVVIFRPKEDSNSPAVNIFIDGEYQSSLLAGAYTQESFCPGSHRLSLAYTNILTKYQEKKRVDYNDSFEKNKIHYFTIKIGSGGKPILFKLSEQKALAFISNLPPRQHHTISRLNRQVCTEK